MRILSIATLLVLPLVGAPAHANDDDGTSWYVQFGVGYNNPTDSLGAPGGDLQFDDGFTMNALVGYQMPLCGERWDWAVELEGYFSDFEVEDDGFASLGASMAEDTSTTAVMANAMLEWQWTEQISVYGGGGIGYAPSIDFDTFGDGEDFQLAEKNAPAMQGKVGLRYRLGGSFSWLIGYRYFQTDDVRLRNGALGYVHDMNNRHHVLEIGFRWSQ